MWRRGKYIFTLTSLEREEVEYVLDKWLFLIDFIVRVVYLRWQGGAMRSAHCATEDTGVTPVFHYPCSQRIYLKWVAGVALCAIPTLDTPRGEAHLYLFLPPTIQR